MYEDFYCYPAVIEQGKNELGVYFPDFDGCISGGKDAREAAMNGREALGLHLYGMEQDGDKLPVPSDPKNIAVGDNEYLIMVDLNYGFFRERMQKKSVDRVVTLPRYLNIAAKEKGINVSQVLQDALRSKLGLQ